MIDLLPCPFCGGEARLTVHEGYHRASCFTATVTEMLLRSGPLPRGEAKKIKDF